MGISERKLREKEELRIRILDAAKKLFIEKGFENTTIRNIADEIEYSPATIYLHFEGGKDEIFYELHNQGFALMLQHFSALPESDRPIERLRRMGEAYIRFAWENPEMYDLMFILTAPMNFSRESIDKSMGTQTFNFLVDVVKAAQREGSYPGLDPEAVAMGIWSAVHGMASLDIRKRVKFMDEPSKAEKMQAAFNFINSYMIL